MTSTAEAGGAIASPVEGEDAFGDDSRLDKKKKFKPFQKMKNFFRGSSKKRFKPDDSGGQKSHSTSALHQSADGQEDDDDGGFRPKAAGLAGSRSISEDSIFKPDVKESKPGVLENKTVSMENIDTNLFQSELFAKLRSRQSDSDVDEGLPYSPSTTLTHHGLMFDTKHMSVPVEGKSTSQESEQSLISVDGSNEDLFASDWQSGVASIKKPRSSSVDSIPEMDMNVADFEAVQMRSTLSNEAAKHRIAVKPKSRRLSAKMSIKRRDRSPAPLQLPELTEESPAKPESESAIGEKQGAHKTIISTTIPVGPMSEQMTSSIPRSEPKDIPVSAGVTSRSEVKHVARSEPKEIPHGSRQDEEIDRSRPRSLSPLSTSPVSQSMLQDVKLRKRPVSGKFDDVEVKKEVDEPSNELAKAFDRAKRISKKFDEGNVVDLGLVKPTVKPVEKEVEIRQQSEVTKPSNLSPKEESKPITVASPVKESAVSPPVTSPVSGVSFVLKKEPLRPIARTPSTETKDLATPKTVTEIQPVITESPTSVTISTVSKDNTEKVASTSNSPAKPVRQGSPEKLASPREDYKLKRAARSKTLPASKDTIDKVENTDMKLAGGRIGSPPLVGRHRNDYENVVIDVKPSTVSTQSKRLSWTSTSETDAAVSSPSEPPWVLKQRIKKLEQEKKSMDNKAEAAKEIKVEVKGVTQLKDENPYMNASQVKEENPYMNASQVNEAKEENIYMNIEPKKESEILVNKVLPTEQKSDIAKGTVQVGSVKSWAQTYSAKPFEKPSAKTSISGVTKTSLEKAPGAYSVRAPVTATPKLDQDSTDKPSIVSNKPAVPIGTKPTLAAVSKPPISGLVKPAPASTTKPTDVASSTNKSFTQSLNSKTSGISGVGSSTATGGFSRSFMQKSGIGVQKTGQDIKQSSQTLVRPSGVSKPESTPSSSNNTVTNQENKKAENDLKNAQTAASASKASSSVEKPKTTLPPVSKPETSSTVPAWKQALNQKKSPAGTQPVKIEIIDKDENKLPKKKVEEKASVQKTTVQMREKTTTEKCSNSAANRPSKVLDMVKSFQNLQVT